MITVTCSRCGDEKPALAKPPLPGDDGALLVASVCQQCWDDWREEEVRTINELRLNFMDPEAQATLRTRMLAFLGLTEQELDPTCKRSQSEASDDGSD